MKKLSVALVLVLVLAMVAGCSAPAAQSSPASSAAASVSQASSAQPSQSVAADSGKKIKIGVSFGTLQEERWNAERIRMQERAKENPNIELIYTDANHDAEKQNSQIENMISQGINVLVIGPQDTDAAAVGAAAAKAAGIPVVSYCRVVNYDKLDAIVSYNYEAIGEENMKNAIAAVPKGNYMLVNGHDADSVPHDENTGYHKIIDPLVKSGDIKVVFDQYIQNWSPDEAMAAVENMLTKEKNDIQAIICNNDGMAGGAVQALIAQNLAGKVYVCGMDSELAAVQRIAEGTQTATVLTGYNPFADAVFDTALTLAKGEKLTSVNATTDVKGAKIPTIQAAPVYITKDNLYKEIVTSGLRKVEDVYKNVPKDKWPTK